MSGPSVDIALLENKFEICKGKRCEDEGIAIPIIKTGARGEKTCVGSIFKFDSKHCMSRHFQGSKVADCGIVLKYQDELYFLIVELKSGKARRNALAQIFSTHNRLKELYKSYNEERNQEENYNKGKSKKEVKKARLIGVIYTKKTTRILVEQIKRWNKKQNTGKEPFVNLVTVEKLENKNLKLDQVVSILLNEEK